jgi:thymidylate synthase
MRIFKNPIEAYDEVGRDLWEMGIRVHTQTMQDKNIADDKDFETVELRAYGYQLSSGFTLEQAEDMLRHTNSNYKWALSDFTERVDPNFVNPGKAYKMRDVWEEFLHDGKFAYTYNERFKTQLNILISELLQKPETRQGILQMYDYKIDMERWGSTRVPCSLMYQVMVREGKLDMIYTMRSCDYLEHFPYDMYLTIRLQGFIADAIGVDRGFFTHNMGSFHAYNKDIKARGIF